MSMRLNIIETRNIQNALTTHYCSVRLRSANLQHFVCNFISTYLCSNFIHGTVLFIIKYPIAELNEIICIRYFFARKFVKSGLSNCFYLLGIASATTFSTITLRVDIRKISFYQPMKFSTVVTD